MKIDSEAAFAAIPGLRLVKDEDDTRVAVTSAWTRPGSRSRTKTTSWSRTKTRARAQDKLMYQGQGVLEIYYTRPSIREASAASRWYKARCGKVVEHLKGEWDGLIRFRIEKIGNIPRVFRKSTSLGFASKPRLMGGYLTQKGGSNEK